MSSDEDVAYLISQVGDEGSPIRKRADEVADYIVTPTVGDFGLRVARSDRDPTPGQVTPRLLRDMLSARVVIADLTGRNANVYYELGVVHSFKRPVIVLVDHVGSLSFDAKNERVIQLGGEDGGSIGLSAAEVAKEKLAESLSVVLEEGYDPSSLVTEVAGGQSLDALAPENPVASEVSRMAERLDQVYRLLRSGRHTTASRGDNMRAMTGLIRSLIRSGRLDDDEVIGLVTEDTSSGFDKWVRDLAINHGYPDPLEQFHSEEDDES